MKVLDTRSKDFRKNFAPVLDRFDAGNAEKKIADTALKIVNDIKKNGDSALFKWTEKLDKLKINSKSIRISPNEMSKAERKVPGDLKSAIKSAYKNIHSFHKNQVEKGWVMRAGHSSQVGQIIQPMERVGLYVPGGTASYPSSVLMNAIPAMVAGVKEIVICSPTPGGAVNPTVLYAASLCKIKEFYTIGGAQAIAAMAYGTKSIAKVDKITGPGNAYVAEAKRLVFGQVDIDMVAGPSEICVIADNTVDPSWIAADLLSQAEHDELSWPILLSPSNKLMEGVLNEIQSQVGKLERKETARKCINKRFHAVKTKSISEAIEIANEIAIEHLELAFKGADKQMKNIRNAGAIFVGNYSPEVLGDYMAGPNHVLPTSGSARFFSPLGVYDFVKRTSIINYSQKDFEAIADKVALFAESEGLTAHANSAKIRKN